MKVQVKIVLRRTLVGEVDAEIDVEGATSKKKALAMIKSDPYAYISEIRDTDYEWEQTDEDVDYINFVD